MSQSLKAQIRQLPLETVEDYTVSNLYGNGVKTTSYEKFGDRNTITPGLRLNWLKQNGIPLDRYAQFVSDELNVDESVVIDRTVEFIRRNPNPSDVRKYVEKRIVQKSKVKPMKAGKLTADDIDCISQKAIKTLGKEVVRRETADYLQDPKGYFGALLDVPACKKDLFSLPLNDQITIIKAMQKKAGTAKKPAVKAATKKSPARKPAVKTKRKFTAKQKSAQNKVAKVNRLAVRSIYEAGEQGKAIPKWGTVLRKAAKKVYA